jgi:hypothetical protein
VVVERELAFYCHFVAVHLWAYSHCNIEKVLTAVAVAAAAVEIYFPKLSFYLQS